MAVPFSLPFTFVNGTIADATQVDADFNACGTSFSNAAESGVNSSITALTGLTTPIAPSVGGSNVFYCTATGTNTILLTTTLPATGFSLTTGYTVIWLGSVTNTGATTVNVNGTGAKNLFRTTANGPDACTGGEVVASDIMVATYDGTQFQLRKTASETGGFGPLTTIASATTTDLGTVASHLALISGIVTITSFGSTADVAFPIYRVIFGGALILTNNNTSLIIPGGANVTTAANDNALLLYLGSGNWQVLIYTRASGQSLNAPQPAVASHSALTIIVATTTTVAVVANAVVMTDGTNFKTGAISATCNLGTNGVVNSLDTGTIAIDTFYFIFAISNGTTIGTLASTSSTTPTMPSGYTFKARIGAVRTIHATATLYGTQQYDNKVEYVVGLASTTALPRAITGSSGSISVPTWTSQSLAAFVPSTAKSYTISLTSGAISGLSSTMAAPNNSYGAISSATNPPPVAYSSGQTAGAGLNSNNSNNLMATFMGVGPVFYASDSANAALCVYGWEDNL